MTDVPASRLDEASRLAYRQAGRAGGPAALLVHGWPNSSYLWRETLLAAGEAGWQAVAPDLPGYGDSPPDPPGTWERHVEALDRFHHAQDLGPVVLVVHDWGGLIGLRWACDHPEKVRALAISDTGFFPDGKWHGLAQTLRTPGDGEQLIGGVSRDALAAVLRSTTPTLSDEAVDEYFKAFADEERRQGTLDLYRSGDFEKLAPYEGKLAALGVPTLLLWGAKDEFAPVASAHRFQREIPGAELVVLEDAGHFLQEDDGGRVASEIVRFLSSLE